MSLVFPPTQLAANAPQTHVLVIGVGEYSHVIGGQAFDPNVPLTAGLRQLTSPVPSAEAFAHWIIAHLDNPAAPLGSVEIALAPGSYDDASRNTVTVDVADFAGIKKAFNHWYARCDRHVDNVAVFYFCGHGLDDNIRMMLLPGDFGASPNQLGDELIDFTTTWYAMGECKAKCQLYILDACREPPLELVRGKVVPRPLKSTTRMVFPPRDAYILNAAPQGQQAHASSYAVSYFTEAVIRSVEKLGARNRNGSVWEVSTDSLTSAVVTKMQRAVADGMAPVPCTRGGSSNFATLIHRIAHPPEVMTEIDIDPAAALACAQLAVERNGTPVKQRGARARSWLFEVEAEATTSTRIFPEASTRVPGGSRRSSTRR